MAITKIAEVTVGSGGAASIDFTSIPGSYTDLMVVLSGRSTRSATSEETAMRVNGLTTGIYSQKILYGNSSTSVYSASESSATRLYSPAVAANSATANTFGNTQFYFPNYAGSTNKSVSIDGVWENNSTNAEIWMHGGLIATTSAITSLTFYCLNSSNWAQYSSATLYGVLKGSSGGVTVS